MKHNTDSFSLEQKSEPFIFDVDSLFYYLDCLTDKRDPRGVRYPLAVALVFVILAKLAGEDHPEAIAYWVSLRKQLLIESLKLKRNRDATLDDFLSHSWSSHFSRRTSTSRHTVFTFNCRRRLVCRDANRWEDFARNNHSSRGAMRSSYGGRSCQSRNSAYAGLSRGQRKRDQRRPASAKKCGFTGENRNRRLPRFAPPRAFRVDHRRRRRVCLDS